MATLTLDVGICTVAFSANCALRMRVSMSAIGSVMLIVSPQALPAGLHYARNLAAHRYVAQLVAAQAELAEHASRPPSQLAAIAQSRGAGIARQLLQLATGRPAIVIGKLGVGDDREQLGAPLRTFLDDQPALLVAVDDSRLGHNVLGCAQFLNGNLKADRSAFASASVFAVVAIVMFMPRIASILSYSISGKMICSLTPRLKLPRPSNERAETPRKSRTRGRAIDTSRSRNSYMRS